MVLFAALTLAGCSNEKEESVKENANTAPVMEAKEEIVYAPFTGMQKEASDGQYFSVMIENSPNARPQTGLGSADIVYEIKTEGNISRYLAFYHDNIPKTIGPVRSSRHYFISLAEDWNSPYIHFGASTYAYKYLRSNEITIPHIDGITEDVYFFRDNTRKAPHNAYLKTDTLDDFSGSVAPNKQMVFGENKMEKGVNTKVIAYRYDNFTHIRYEYDENEKVFLRFQEGKPQIDRDTNEQIKVKNIIFQFAEHQVISDDKYGRIDVELTGSGKYIYISEGKRTDGTWKKGFSDNSTTYYDETGNVLTLNRGNTWIQVVETNDKIEMSQ